MDWAGCDIVEVIPGKVSGVPLVRDSRVPADFVVESLRLGETIEEVAYNYHLDADLVRRLQEFAQENRLTAVA